VTFWPLNSKFTVITDNSGFIQGCPVESGVYRCVSILKSDDNHPIDIIRESFLGCHDQSAAGVSSLILEITDGKGLPLERCRGQGYDGASTMSGVQKRILDIQPKAIYIHCAGHNLNHVLNDAVSGVTEVQTFFTDLQHTFFGHSIRRWEILLSFTGRLNLK